MLYFYEGQVDRGNYKGFGRMYYHQTKHMFVGFFNFDANDGYSNYKKNAGQGLGVSVEKTQLETKIKYSGVWGDKSAYWSMPCVQTSDFTKFEPRAC
jgi:hypothetical protein